MSTTIKLLGKFGITVNIEQHRLIESVINSGMAQAVALDTGYYLFAPNHSIIDILADALETHCEGFGLLEELPKGMTFNWRQQAFKVRVANPDWASFIHTVSNTGHVESDGWHMFEIDSDYAELLGVSNG